MSFNPSQSCKGVITISSYNCGGLPYHIDYIMAPVIEEIMKARKAREPIITFVNEDMQRIGLKYIFSKDLSRDKQTAKDDWIVKKYRRVIKKLTMSPRCEGSVNKSWFNKIHSLMPLNKFHSKFTQPELFQGLLNLFFACVSSDEKTLNISYFAIKRLELTKEIFNKHLTQDIICLQEANYINRSHFPSHYEIIITPKITQKDQMNNPELYYIPHINAIAWNKERFKINQYIGTLSTAIVVSLKDQMNQKIVLVASLHLKGCDPYYPQEDLKKEKDSLKGDKELTKFLKLFHQHQADIYLIAIDANVTSLHPRLSILKKAGYKLDYKNHLEPSCTSPYQLLNTRIDWIFIRSSIPDNCSITNVAVPNIHLNDIDTNISDHKPIAAKVTYKL